MIWNFTAIIIQHTCCIYISLLFQALIVHPMAYMKWYRWARVRKSDTRANSSIYIFFLCCYIHKLCHLRTGREKKVKVMCTFLEWGRRKMGRWNDKASISIITSCNGTLLKLRAIFRPTYNNVSFHMCSYYKWDVQSLSFEMVQWRKSYERWISIKHLEQKAISFVEEVISCCVYAHFLKANTS